MNVNKTSSERIAEEMTILGIDVNDHDDLFYALDHADGLIGLGMPDENLNRRIESYLLKLGINIAR